MKWNKIMITKMSFHSNGQQIKDNNKIRQQFKVNDKDVSIQIRFNRLLSRRRRPQHFRVWINLLFINYYLIQSVIQLIEDLIRLLTLNDNEIDVNQNETTISSDSNTTQSSHYSTPLSTPFSTLERQTTASQRNDVFDGKQYLNWL